MLSRPIESAALRSQSNPVTLWIVGLIALAFTLFLQPAAVHESSESYRTPSEYGNGPETESTSRIVQSAQIPNSTSHSNEGLLHLDEKTEPHPVMSALESGNVETKSQTAQPGRPAEVESSTEIEGTVLHGRRHSISVATKCLRSIYIWLMCIAAPTLLAGVLQLRREVLRISDALVEAHERDETLRRSNQELAHMTCVDSLTGLANRRCFDEAFERARSNVA